MQKLNSNTYENLRNLTPQAMKSFEQVHQHIIIRIYQNLKTIKGLIECKIIYIYKQIVRKEIKNNIYEAF